MFGNYFIWTAAFIWLNVADGESACSIHELFKIQSDNNKYEIGGVFPLHESDCKKLDLSSVQDIVAIQWALTHWNQNPKNTNTGLHAGESCSVPRMAVSQTLKILDSLSYNTPEECRSSEQQQQLRKPMLLGMLSPKDGDSAEAVAAVVQAASLPLIAYSFQAADALSQLNLTNVASTAPTFNTYTDALIHLLKNLNSNLVSVVSNERRELFSDRLIEQLASAGIHVADSITTRNGMHIDAIQSTDSKIIISLLPADELRRVLTEARMALNKTLLVMDFDDEFTSAEPVFQKFISESDLETFNCTLDEDNQFGQNQCSNVDSEVLSLNYKQTLSVQSAIRAVYALAALTGSLEKNSQIAQNCQKLSGNCAERLMSGLESMVYDFDNNDPLEFAGTNLHFYWETESMLMANGIVIEGIQVVNDGRFEIAEVKVMEYETGLKPRFAMTKPRNHMKMRSYCTKNQHYCGSCPLIASVGHKQFYLSNPKQYSLYFMGFFDFHGGRMCRSHRNTDITLPLSFIHTIATFRERYPQVSLLKNLEIGALLVDSCSSGRTAIETIVLSKSHCFQITQGNQNITISPHSIFGHASALNGRTADALKSYFVAGENVLVSIDVERDAAFDTYSTMPSKKYEAQALIKLLKKFSWESVSVILSEQAGYTTSETESKIHIFFPSNKSKIMQQSYGKVVSQQIDQDSNALATFRYFEQMALENGICISETKIVGGEKMNAFTSTNVTLLFTNAIDAANYFSAELRTEESDKHVHIMVGDAHDFYLHDPSNVARFVGTISLQPKNVVYDDFRNWLDSVTPLSVPEQWYWQFVENRWQCAMSEANRNLFDGKVCTGDELLDVPSLGRMTKSGYFARGIERFLFALDAVYKRLCTEQAGVCEAMLNKGQKQILKLLDKAQIDNEFQIYEFSMDEGGVHGFVNIGHYDTRNGLTFVESRQSSQVSNGSNLRKQRITSRCTSSNCKCYWQIHAPSSLPTMADAASDGGSYVHRVPANEAYRQFQSASILDRLATGQWHLKTWNYALVAMITALIIGALGVLVLAMIKLYYGVIRGNQSLGLSLLAGVILLYFTAYAFVFDPTDFVCRMRIVLHPISYTLCFGVIIAKATQLKNAETLGFSDVIHISYWNYWLLLLFIIGVQIALSTRWLTEEFASVLVLNELQSRLVCRYGADEFLLSQAYPIILLLLSLFINSRNKNIKRNYKETKWLLIASVSCSIIWVAWLAAYISVPSQLKDTVVVIELIFCASTLLGFIFGPKIYIMLSYEPVIIEMHPQNAIKDFPTDNAFFEKVDVNQQQVISSPNRVRNQAFCRAKNCQNPPAGHKSCNTTDQLPIFRTVMRKKNRLKRSKSLEQQG